jgi:hypothetical protein
VWMPIKRRFRADYFAQVDSQLGQQRFSIG